METLIGQNIKKSSKLEKMIEDLVKETMAHNSKITGVRDADPKLADYNKAMIDRCGVDRGRPLFYNYVGTGAGNGVYAELSDGSVKLDLINGIGINIFGHSHPKLIEASIRGALEDVVVQGNLQPNTGYARLLKDFVAIAGKGTPMKHAWLATCGTIANENALKIVRQKHSPARKIVAMNNAFAGRSTMMAEITDNPDYKQGLPTYDDVLRVDFFDPKNPQSGEHTLNQLKKLIAENKGNIACFTFEPMQGEGGFRRAPKEFFVPLLKLCKENNIAVWADEVQTFCRTGQLFAVETLGIAEYIDVITVAKTLQNGATLFRDEYNPKPGLIAGTFAGSSVTLECGLQVLKTLTEDNYLGPKGKIAHIHDKFVSGLQKLAETTCKGRISEIDGLGLMLAFTPMAGTKDNMMNTLKALFKNNLITFGCGHGPYRIRFLIPAIITDKDIDVAMQIIEKSLLEQTA